MIFVVCYPQGASGSFLSALLERVYYGESKEFSPYTTDEQNCAHKTHQYQNYLETQPDRSIVSPPDRFNLLQIVDPDSPAFFPIHSFNPPSFRKRFPESKIIAIIPDETDSLEISINVLYKFFLTEERYRNRKDLNGKILPDSRWLYHPCPPLVDDIRTTDTINFTREQKRKLVLLFKSEVLSSGFHLLGSDPSVYGSNIWFIKYRDIQDNRAGVIKILENVTGKQAGPAAWEALDYYVERQQTMIDKIRKELDL